MADGGLGIGAASPVGAGLGDEAQPKPVLTMGERHNLYVDLRNRGMDDTAISAEMAGYGYEAPAATPAEGTGAPPPPADTGVGWGGEIAYGSRAATEGALRSVGEIGEDWFGADGFRDTMYDIGEAAGPSAEQEAAQAAQAADPDRTLLGGAADAIAQEAAPTGLHIVLPIVGGAIGGFAGSFVAPVAGTAAGASAGVTAGKALATGISYLRGRNESRDKAVFEKARRLYGDNPTEEQLASIKLDDNEKKLVEGAALVKTAMDAVVPVKAWGRLAPDVAGEAVTGVARKAIKEGAKDAGMEGVTEVGQTAVDAIAFDEELRRQLTEEEVRDSAKYVRDYYGEEVATGFIAGAGLGGTVGATTGAYGQKMANAKLRNDVKVLTGAAQNADVDIGEFEGAAGDPKRAGQLASDADRIRRAEANLRLSQEQLDGYAAQPEEAQDKDELSALQAHRDRTKAAYDRTHDEIMPRYGGMTLKQVSDRQEQIKKEAHTNAQERARSAGFTIEQDTDPTVVASVMEPLEEAQADYDRAIKKSENTVDERFRSKYAKDARDAKARVRAAKINARKHLYGEDPKEAEHQLDREAGIDNHRRRLFGGEQDPKAVIEQADRVIAQRSELGKVKENRQRSQEKLTKLYEQRDAAETEPEIEEIETKIAKERAKLSQPDPLTEAAVRAKRDAQKALGIEPSPDEVANPMAGVPQDEGAQEAEVEKEEAPAVIKPKPKPKPKQLEFGFDKNPDPDQAAFDFDAPAAQEEADVDVTPTLAAGVDENANRTEAGHQLPEEPDKYFERTPDSSVVPVSSLQPIRARPTGIANAGKFMRDAYDGKMARRKPISVEQLPNGSYRILDGNSTYANMLQAGWSNIPVRVMTKAQFTEESVPKFAKKTGTEVRAEKGVLHVRGPGKSRQAARDRAKKEGLTLGSYEVTDATLAPDDPKRMGPTAIIDNARHPWRDAIDDIGADATLETAEDWLATHKPAVEYMGAFGPDGALLGFGSNGNWNGVAMPSAAEGVEGVTLTHNHPNETPHSPGDIGVLAKQGITALRAVAPSGTSEVAPASLAGKGYKAGLAAATKAQDEVVAAMHSLGTVSPETDKYAMERLAQEATLQVLEADGMITYTVPYKGLTPQEQEIVDGIVARTLEQRTGNKRGGARLRNADRSTAAPDEKRPDSAVDTERAQGVSGQQGPRPSPEEFERINTAWRAEARRNFPELDDLYAEAEANQTRLAELSQRVAERTGLTYKNGGVKKRDRAEEKLNDRRLKAPDLGAGALTDVVRGGFIAPTVADVERAIDALQEIAPELGLEVLPEPWNVTEAGYADRSVAVRMPNGQIGELQLWEPHLYLAKEGANPHTMQKIPGFPKGHDLYKKARSSKDPAEVAALNEQMRELYASAVSLAPPDLQALIFGKDPSLRDAVGNRSRQLISDSLEVDGASSNEVAPASQTPSTASNQNTAPGVGATAASPSALKNSTGIVPYSDIAQGITEHLTTFNVPAEARPIVNAVLTGEVPAKSVGKNKAAAKFIEARYAQSGHEAIEKFTGELTPAQLDLISSILAAETAAGLERTGNASSWYTGSMERMYDVVSKHWPVLSDDAVAAELGLGNANNARFVFTYIMASTSQNLDVMANAKATQGAFDDFLAAAAKGQYRIDPKFATGDKQKAMATNFRKFGKLMAAIDAPDVATKLEAMDALFRERRTVKEWTDLMAARGMPYSPPGQTAKSAIVYGSSTLGPKIGNGFWQNLNGNYEPVTIDLWMRRTWGRLTGKSIGNESAYPDQARKLRASSLRSFEDAGKADVLAEAKIARDGMQADLAQIMADGSYPTKKAKDDAARAVKRQIKLLNEVIPDIANLKVPEPWPAGLKATDKDGVIAYASTLKKAWEREYKNIAKAHKAQDLGSVPSHVQPTWARAAKMLIATQTTPLDQVANGTQRQQIEKAIAMAREKLAAQGIEISAADMQAVLWYPEKDLWNGLTARLEVDSQGNAIVKPSPLNESYDTAFEKIFAGADDGQQGEAGDGSGGAGSGTQPALTDAADPDVSPDEISGDDGNGGAGAETAGGVGIAFGRETYPESRLRKELGVESITPEQAQRLIGEAARITGVSLDGPPAMTTGGWFDPDTKTALTEPSTLITLGTDDLGAAKRFAAVLGQMGGQHSMLVNGDSDTGNAGAIAVTAPGLDPVQAYEALQAVNPTAFGGFSADGDTLHLTVFLDDVGGPEGMTRLLEQVNDRIGEIHDGDYTTEAKRVDSTFVGAETDKAGQRYDLSLRDDGTGQQAAQGYLRDADQFSRTVFGDGTQDQDLNAPPVAGEPTPLYVARPVIDDGGLRQHFEQAGLTNLLAPDDMHVTVTYSRDPVDIGDVPAKTTPRTVTAAGAPKKLDKALVQPLAKAGTTLDHQRYRKAGASHDYSDGYQPHVTLKYDPTPEEEALAAANPFKGKLQLGPEKQKRLKEGWRPEPDTDEVAQGLFRRQAKQAVVVPDWLDTGYVGTGDTVAKVIDAAKTPTKTARSALEATEDAVFNQFAPIRRLEIQTRGKLATGAESAFKAAEMAINDSGRAEALMYYGAAELGPNGQFKTKNDTMGLRPIFDLAVSKSKNKGQGIVDWMAYMAARRAEQLHQRGIKTPLSEQDVAAALAKETPEYRKAADEWKKHNDANIDFLVDTGRITEQQAEAMKADDAYVPFYRSDAKMADGSSPDFDLNEWLGQRGGNMTAGGAVMRRDPGIKKIVGGDKKAIDNLMTNMIRNSQAMVAAGMRNRAANLSFDLMEEAGLASTVKATKVSKKTGAVVRREKPANSVRMWVDGKEKFVVVQEEAAHLVQALGGLQPTQLQGLGGLMAQVASVFRQGITLSPAFIARNLIRGAVSTGIMTSGANLTASSNTFTGLVGALRKSDATKAFVHQSGMGDYRFGGSDVGFGKDDLLIEYGMAPKTIGFQMRRAMNAMEAVGTATELADRVAAYETMIKRGIRPDEAAYQALTIMNYSRRGNAAAVRTLLPMIPFLNARLQGLSRLAEGAVGRKGELPRKQALMQLMLNGGVLAAASMAFWAMNNEDEEKREKYLAEPSYRKLNYHILYAGDKTIYIPKAFEIGHLFSSIPELMLDGIVNDAPEQIMPGLKQIALQTFGFNAIPAALLPIVETQANYDFFRQEPIEGQREADLLARDRTTGASALSVFVGQKLGMSDVTGVSPAMMEKYFQGYGGAYYYMLAGMADMVGSELGLTPSKEAGAFGTIPVISPMMERSFGSIVKSTPQQSNKFLGDFYDTKDHIDQIYNSAKAAATNGDVEYARNLLSQVPGLPVARTFMNRANKQMGDLNSAIRLTRQDPNLTSAQKAARLAPMIQMRNDLAAKVMELVNQIEETQGAAFASVA